MCKYFIHMHLYFNLYTNSCPRTNSYVCTQMWNESLVSQSWFMAPKHPTSKRFISNWTNMRNLSFNSKLGLDSTQTKFFRRCRTIQWPIDLLPKIPKFNEFLSTEIYNTKQKQFQCHEFVLFVLFIPFSYSASATIS